MSPKDKENPSEKILKLVDGLLPKGKASESLDDASDPSAVEQNLQRILVEGVRKLQEEGGDVQKKVSAFVAQMIGIAESLGADTKSLASQAIALLAEAPGGGRPARKKDTRTVILDAALDVFSEQGFHASTVDQIAEAAGLGKGTLYRYFPTKDALYQALVIEKWNQLISKARIEFQDQDDVIDSIEAATRAYLEFFESNAKLYRLLLKEPLSTEQEMRAQYMEMLLNEIPSIQEKIVRAGQTGRFKGHNFYTVFYGYMGFVEGVIQKWLRNDCRHSLVEELPVIMDTVLYGFVSEGVPERAQRADKSSQTDNLMNKKTP